MRTGGGCFSIVRICIGEVCVRSRCGAARAFDVERVHVVARGMMLGNIQRFEIVVGRFDLGAFDDAESDRQRKCAAALRRSGGSGGACRWRARCREAKGRFSRGLRGLFRGSFDFCALFLNARFDMRLELVQLLTDGAFQFRRRRFQPIVGDLRETRPICGRSIQQARSSSFLDPSIESHLLIKGRRNSAKQCGNLPASSRAELGERLVVGSFIVMVRAFDRAAQTRPLEPSPNSLRLQLCRRRRARYAASVGASNALFRTGPARSSFSMVP